MNKYIVKKLLLEKQFLTYLEVENVLTEFQRAVKEYNENVNVIGKVEGFIIPFRFQLKLDLMKIQEISENLYYLFKKEPEKGKILAEKVILCALNLISCWSFTKYDIQVTLLVVNLPVTVEILDLLNYPSPELESIQGVLVAKTTVTKYVRSRIYCCSLEYCPGRVIRRYWGNNEPKMCSLCFGHTEEDVSATDTGEEIIFQLISPETYTKMGRFQVVKVRIRDELCNLTELQIGEEYKVIGRLNENFFEAMNITPKQLEPDDFFNLLPINSPVLPESITNLYFQVRTDCPDCPWSFVSALSSLLASDLIPVSSFLHLKTGLILCLSTQKNEGSPIPLVAIGPDSLNAQILFQAAGKLAERYIRVSAVHSYLGGTTKPGLQSNVIWEEAGQLVLASKGVCNLGDWNKFKKEQANYLCQTIESGQIVSNKGKTNLIHKKPLKCSVWTYWCHITTKQSDQLQLKTLINIFGMPFIADEKNELELEKICRKNLSKGKEKNSSNTEQVPLEDVKQFIEIINSRDLTLTDSASQLIRNYFVVSRRERPQCLPLGAIKTMTSLAEAHARLSLRDEVIYEDVVAIIYLYEEAIFTLFGECLNPYPKLQWNQKEPIYVFMSKQLQHFKKWLEEFISD